MLALLLFFYSITPGQINPSVSSQLRYGNGEQSINTIKQDFKYFESLTDFRLGLPSNLALGFRLLYDDPPETGPVFKGLKRKFIEYNGDDFDLRAGDFSELYGKGLLINLFEDRGLAYDTWVEGIKAGYRKGIFKFSIMGGSMDFYDSVQIARIEKYKVRAGNAEIALLDNQKLGLSFAESSGDIPGIVNTAHIQSESPELYADLNAGNFNFNVNWSQNRIKIMNENLTHTGSGLYSSVSYSGPGFGVTVDYKNYRYDIVDPFNRNDNTRPTKMLPFQNPPIVYREQSYKLISRPVHQIDFNDEVGAQMEVFYSPDENLSFTFNTSISSRHFKYNYDPAGFSFKEERRNNSWLPSVEDEYSPFTEFFLEAEYYYDGLNSVRTAFSRRTKTVYNDFTGIAGSENIRSIVIPVQWVGIFTNYLSGVLDYEYEYGTNNYNGTQPNFLNHYFSGLISIFSQYTFGIRYELTNNRFELSDRKDWLSIEAGYRITDANIITVIFGNERGGLVCTNGVCRYILPFSGTRVNLNFNI